MRRQRPDALVQHVDHQPSLRRQRPAIACISTNGARRLGSMCRSQLSRVTSSHSSRSNVLALLTRTPIGPSAPCASGSTFRSPPPPAVGLQHLGAAARSPDLGRERVGLRPAAVAVDARRRTRLRPGPAQIARPSRSRAAGDQRGFRDGLGSRQDRDRVADRDPPALDHLGMDAEIGVAVGLHQLAHRVGVALGGWGLTWVALQRRVRLMTRSVAPPTWIVRSTQSNSAQGGLPLK